MSRASRPADSDVRSGARRGRIALGLAFLVTLAALVALAASRSSAALPVSCWYCATTGEIRAAPEGEPIHGYGLYPFPASAGSTRRGLVALPVTLSNRLDDWVRGGHEIRGWALTGTGETRPEGETVWERCLLEPIAR